MELDVIYNEDCLQGMKRLPDESVDLVMTDPPYSLKFMQMAWDQALPNVAIWQECLRVLKPGAFAFVMCIPRQDCLARMIVNLEDAGFNISFSPIYHTFATGFPKSGNVSKMIDRRAGVEQEIVGVKRCGFGNRNGKTDAQGGVFLNSLPEELKHINITAPASPEAKALDGSYAGLQMKPAVEVVLCVMKPLSEKTYIDQALANGKGISWLDEGRIPLSKFDEEDYIPNRVGYKDGINHKQLNSEHNECVLYDGGLDANQGEKTNVFNPQGRFPANVLVSDDVLDDGIERPAHISATLEKRHVQGVCYGTYKYRTRLGYSDSGSYSRFFSLDSWWAERIKQLPESVQKTFPWMIVPKASKKEKGEDNHHPTCKPIKLMSYLITIGSREGDIILDPFLGSGTTAVAAKMLNRRYVGYEIGEDYCEIAERRIAAVNVQADLFSEAAQ